MNANKVNKPTIQAAADDSDDNPIMGPGSVGIGAPMKIGGAQNFAPARPQQQ